ncbi:SusD family protein [compost metagenome]
MAVEHERRVELAFEFQRWFDLKRTNRVVDVLTAKGKPVTQNKLVFPIPNFVRDQNAKITQNAGY